jgi:hypothetical protein
MSEVQAHDPIVAAVQADLAARSNAGLAKYGVGLDRTDLTRQQWAQHAYEEALDLACYLKRLLAAMNDEQLQEQGSFW